MKMARWLNALPLTLALVALTVLTASCGSTNLAQVRVINAIPNASSALDVDFNSNKAVTSLAFGSIDPPQATPAVYMGLSSGIDTIEAFLAGQTINPVVDSTTANLNSATNYTVLLAGFVPAPAAYLIADTNKAPGAGIVQFRVINASASSTAQFPGGFDIYFLPVGQSVSGTPQIPGLTLGQAGPGYINLNYLASYTVWVTPHNNTTPLFSATYPQATAQITTLVIIDQPGGAGVSSTMLSLIDMQ